MLLHPSTLRKHAIRYYRVEALCIMQIRIIKLELPMNMARADGTSKEINHGLCKHY